MYFEDFIYNFKQITIIYAIPLLCLLARRGWLPRKPSLEVPVAVPDSSPSSVTTLLCCSWFQNWSYKAVRRWRFHGSSVARGWPRRSCSRHNGTGSFGWIRSWSVESTWCGSRRLHRRPKCRRKTWQYHSCFAQHLKIVKILTLQSSLCLLYGILQHGS